MGVMLLCLWAGGALAGDWEGYDDSLPAAPAITVTVEPLRLVERPVLDVGVEIRGDDTKSFRINVAKGVAGTRAPTEVGMQLRHYIGGDFGNGLALGGEVKLIEPNLSQWRVSRAQFGPFFAVKLTASIFSVELRGGAEMTLGAGRPALGPTMGLGVGMSL